MKTERRVRRRPDSGKALCPTCAGRGLVPLGDCLVPCDGCDGHGRAAHQPEPIRSQRLYVATSGDGIAVDSELSLPILLRRLENACSEGDDMAVWAAPDESVGEGWRLVAVLRPGVGGLSLRWI
jgi:hypothetical protein